MPFFTKASYADRSKFCSRKCYWASMGERIITKCVGCEKEFPITNWYIKNGKGKYCSRQCRKTSIKTNCKECNKEFVSKPISRRKYCSRNCYNKALKTGTHFFRHGLSRSKEYKVVHFHKRRASIKEAGGSFTLQEWEILKAKCDYRCQMCMKIEPEIKLTVDHKIPVSKGGNNYIENIQPLCGKCNSKKNARIFDGGFVWESLEADQDLVTQPA